MDDTPQPVTVPAETPKRAHIFLCALLVVLVSLAVYFNTLSAGFVNWDDPKLVLENPYVRGLTWENLRFIWTRPILETYLPLRVTSYAIDYEIWNGYNPLGFHLTNVILHAVVSLLVFGITRRLTGSLAAALFAGLLFAVHPVHSEVAAWVSGRKDVLSTALVLLSFYMYIKARHPASPRLRRTEAAPLLVVSVGVFVLAGLAKAMVVTLPVFIVLYDVLFAGALSGGRWKRLLPAWVAYFAAAAVITGIAGHFASTAGAVRPWHFGSMGRTFLFMSWAALFYIKTMFWPSLLSARYPYGDTLEYGVNERVVNASPLILALMLAVALVIFVRAIAASNGRTRRTGRPSGSPLREAGDWLKLAALGLAWFFIGLLPVMNIVPISVLVADRYLYLPSVGWTFAAAAVLWLVWGRERIERPLEPSHRITGGESAGGRTQAATSATLSTGITGGQSAGSRTQAATSGTRSLSSQTGHRVTARMVVTVLLCAALVVAGGIRTVTRNRVWRDSLSLWASVVGFPKAAARGYSLPRHWPRSNRPTTTGRSGNSSAPGNSCRSPHGRTWRAGNCFWTWGGPRRRLPSSTPRANSARANGSASTRRSCRGRRRTSRRARYLRPSRRWRRPSASIRRGRRGITASVQSRRNLLATGRHRGRGGVL
jgi:hypothetical protein